MDDPARRFSGLFSCKPADNPFLVAGLPALNLGGDCFVRQIEKGRERWGFRYPGQRLPLRDAKNLRSRFAMQRHERQGAVRCPEIYTDAETGSCHGRALLRPDLEFDLPSAIRVY